MHCSKNCSLRKILILATSLIFLLSACRNTKNPPEPNPPSVPASPLDKTATISDIVTQGLAVKQYIDLEVLNYPFPQSTSPEINNLHFHTLHTFDLDGRPSVNITFVTTEAVDDFWAYAKKVAEAPDTEIVLSPHPYAITGGNTVQEVIIGFGLGTTFLTQLHKTRAKFPEAKIDNILTVDPEHFLLQTSNGTYWNVSDQTQASDEEIKAWRELYHETAENLLTPEYVAYINQSWRILTDLDYKPSAEYLELYEKLFEALQNGDAIEADSIEKLIYELQVSEGLQYAELENPQEFWDNVWKSWDAVKDADGNLDIEKLLELLEKRDF